MSAIRNVVRIAPTGGNATLRPLYEEGSDFANSLRANDPELRDAVITITPPAGEPVRFASGAVKPGESVAEHASAALPAATERSEEEELDAYLARLAAADGSVLRGSARATVQTTVGRLPVPQARANTALRLPLLTLDKTGPGHAVRRPHGRVRPGAGEHGLRARARPRRDRRHPRRRQRLGERQPRPARAR